MSPSRVQNLTRLLVASTLIGWAAVKCHGQTSRAQQAANAKRVLAWSASKLGVREATGRNDGPEVEAFLKVSGNHKGDPWCGAYQAAGQKANALPLPAGAGGARNWTQPANKRTYYIRGTRGSIDSLKPGHQVTFYYANLGRVGHVGRAVAAGRAIRKGRPVRGWYTNEGNTGTGGGREGAGVHQLYRASTDFYAAANWLYWNPL